MTDAHQEAARRNAGLQRADIEWAVGPHGIYLRDRPDWSRQHTEEISKRHERERQECSRNNQLRPVGPD